MHQSFVQLLACPVCKGDLHLESASPAVQTLAEGNIICDNGHTVPIARGIPRFVASDGYDANFGFEWNLHNKTQLDTATERESEETFHIKSGFEPRDVDGKLVLDVGCGMGRFTDVASRWGATVVGIDLTSAVDAASPTGRAPADLPLAPAGILAPPSR